MPISICVGVCNKIWVCVPAFSFARARSHLRVCMCVFRPLCLSTKIFIPVFKFARQKQICKCCTQTLNTHTHQKANLNKHTRKDWDIICNFEMSANNIATTVLPLPPNCLFQIYIHKNKQMPTLYCAHQGKRQSVMHTHCVKYTSLCVPQGGLRA